MSDAAGKEFWNSAWAELPPLEPYQGPVFEHHPVLNRFLAKGSGGDAIEVGCVPGNYMIYLAKEFGYRVSGIDYSDKLPYVRANLRLNGIRDAELFHGDFFQFIPRRQYDLVFSSGFVEHFDDYKLAVQKHEALAAPGGLVVIIVPNLTHVHRALCGYFAPEILSVHRFPLMHAEILKKTLEDTGGGPALRIQQDVSAYLSAPPSRRPMLTRRAERLKAVASGQHRQSFWQPVSNIHFAQAWYSGGFVRLRSATPECTYSL